MSQEQRHKLIDKELARPKPKGEGAVLSIVKQCAFLQVHRSGFYYTATPTADADLRLMRVIDRLHMEDPCMGTRMLSKELRAMGIFAGRSRVRRLMRLMRIKAVYCAPRTTVIDRIKYKHPYLLRDLAIVRRNQVWAVDITYLPVRGGFMYMVAVIDVHTRYLLNWSVSNSMDAAWVVAMIKQAITLHGKPEIINSDQGSQFTSEEYTALFRKGGAAEGVKISMDGKGRAIDNVFIERFWRTLKHNHLYLAPPADGIALYASCKRFIDRYNNRRLHSSLAYRTPAACYLLAA